MGGNESIYMIFLLYMGVSSLLYFLLLYWAVTSFLPQKRVMISIGLNCIYLIGIFTAYHYMGSI